MGAALRRLVSASWERRTITTLLLWPVSLLYRALVGLRRHLYLCGILRVHRSATPVVVVGNVVAGGGGKTPVVMALVRHLQSRGFRTGVISRGYGRRRRDCREVLESSSVDEVGDEPILIHRTTGAPVFVASARIDAARALLARHPAIDVIVCDDGLQHHGLFRDVEICVFDDRGTGNGLMLPAGPLREPWPRRIDLVLSTRGDKGVHGFSVQRELASHARRADGTMVALQDLRLLAAQPRRSLRAVAGIARPNSFFEMLRANGLHLARTDALADHALFDDRDWTGDEHTLLCTEKDAVKLWRHRPDALAVPLELRIDPAFWSAFDRLLALRLGAKL